MARTIDNLGVDISNRYAEDQEIFDETLTKEARTIPNQTRILATYPSYTSEFDTLFDLGMRNIHWALFLAPPNYYSSRRKLFAEQLAPDLGSLDMQDAQIEKVEAYGEQEKERRRQNHASPKEEEEIELEKKILLTLLQKIHHYDQELVDINSRRSQYQRG